jgi:Ca-activated chloride channel family protein
MKISIVLNVLFVCVYVPLYGIFEHDRAAYAAQKQNWQEASTLMVRAVGAQYQDASTLYDAGVASFKAGQYEHAQAYFANVAQQTAADQHKVLQEQALYNLGNTYVKLEKLEQAVTSYEQALAIDPGDRRAQHNLDVVRRMLEQKKQQEQDNKDKKNDEKNDDKKNQRNQKNKQEKNNDGAQSEQQRDQQGNDQQDQDGKDQQGSHEHDQGDDPRKGQEQNKSGGMKQKNGAQNHQRQQESHGDDGNEQKKSQKNDGNQKAQRHMSGNQQQESNAHTSDDARPENSREGVIARILQEQEASDLQLNKHMIKTCVGKKLAGQDGQNCW